MFILLDYNRASPHNIDDLTKSLQTLTASDPSSNKNLRQFLNFIKLPLFDNENHESLVSMVLDEIKKVEEQAKQIIEQNKDLILGGKPVKDSSSAAVEQFTEGLNALNTTFQQMSQVMNKEIDLRRAASLHSQQLHKRNAQVQLKEDENLNMYDMFDDCLLKLGDIPILVSCFVFECLENSTTIGPLVTSPADNYKKIF